MGMGWSGQATPLGVPRIQHRPFPGPARIHPFRSLSLSLHLSLTFLHSEGQGREGRLDPRAGNGWPCSGPLDGAGSREEQEGSCTGPGARARLSRASEKNRGPEDRTTSKAGRALRPPVSGSDLDKDCWIYPRWVRGPRGRVEGGHARRRASGPQGLCRATSGYVGLRCLPCHCRVCHPGSHSVGCRDGSTAGGHPKAMAEGLYPGRSHSTGPEARENLRWGLGRQGVSFLRVWCHPTPRQDTRGFALTLHLPLVWGWVGR